MEPNQPDVGTGRKFSTFLVFACCIAMLVAIAVSAWVERTAISFAPMTVILVYAFIALFVEPKRPDSLIAVADNAYFLGYLGTMAAVGILVAKIYWIGRIPDDIGPIAHLAAVALWTSIVGLVVMSVIKTYGRKLGQQVPPVQFLPAALESLIDAITATTLPREVSQAVADIREVSVSAQRLIDTTAISDNATKNLTNSINALGGEIGKLSRYLATANERATLFVDNVKQMQQILDDYVALLKRKLDETM